MPTIRTRIIPLPHQTVPVGPGVLPVLTGQGGSLGDIDYECGDNRCRQILIRSVSNQVRLGGALVRCPRCGQSSEIPS